MYGAAKSTKMVLTKRESLQVEAGIANQLQSFLTSEALNPEKLNSGIFKKKEGYVKTKTDNTNQCKGLIDIQIMVDQLKLIISKAH